MPAHGLEYRVPGNFWLRDYILQSGIFAIARLAGKACEGLTKENGPRSDVVWAKDMLTKNVDFAEVEQVINTNDFDGALRIYKDVIRPFADAIQPNAGFGNGLMDDFEFFVHTIREEGLKGWFLMDDKRTLSRWTHVTTGTGWERFLTSIVQNRRAKAKFTGIILDRTATSFSDTSDLRIAA